MARRPSGTLSIDPRPVGVEPIAAAALDVLRPMIDVKAIEVTMREPADAAVIGDAQRVRQVFWNVLSNAAKFTPRGGEITVATKMDAGLVQVMVEDTGRESRTIFWSGCSSSSNRRDAILTREHGGLGLGPAISQTWCGCTGERLPREPAARRRGVHDSTAHRVEGSAVGNLVAEGGTRKPEAEIVVFFLLEGPVRRETSNRISRSLSPSSASGDPAVHLYPIQPGARRRAAAGSKVRHANRQDLGEIHIVHRAPFEDPV